jgi:UDP-N-acetyl-D-mannosaminuronic acid dehydrogenase
MTNNVVCVVGLGYIGLPTASLLATKGFQVHGVDVNKRIVDNLNQGRVLIHEPSLDVMVKSAVNSGNLVAAFEPKPADIFIIAVPTPFKDDHAPDLSFVDQATKAIAPHLQPGNLVILESTSPVGTTEQIAATIAEHRPDLEVSRRCLTSAWTSLPVYVAHCPERVLPGQILRELVENDRIVGGIDAASTQKAKDFYKLFVSGRVLVTDSRTAELSKLVENAYRDVNIAFANELSLICDKMDISVWELIHLANHHPRVNILQPGPGVGGHCIAVDPWFVIHAQPELTPLMHTARKVNEFKAEYVIEKIKAKSQRFKRPIIACLGLSYKSDVDDLRESPSLEIVKHLALSGDLSILAVEPNIGEKPDSLPDSVTLAPLDQALDQADILVCLVAHKEFRLLNPQQLKDKIVLDFVNVFSD